MRAIAGSILVLAAAVVIAGARLAFKLATRTDPDDDGVNFALTAGALALAAVGVALVLGRSLPTFRAEDRGPPAPPG